ncbi:MAG: hypothetical protein ACYCVL_13620 [Gemmatimonadaceae bacterium]
MKVWHAMAGVVGILAALRVGRATLFVNAENLTNVRQISFGPLLRPARSLVLASLLHASDP